MSGQTYPGPTQMVKIDGSKVKSLRESKGLTQLYIATVVGVTTDTISRWENKRYPSIKEENGLKLAEALGVPLDEILEKEEEPPVQHEAPATSFSQSKKSGPSRIFIWLLLLAFVLLLPFIWYGLKQPEPVVTIRASRLLPPHTPAGQPFPVIIQVTTKQQGPFSLILKENLPAGCEPLTSAPPFTGFDSKTGSLKWIARTTGEVTTFVYLARQQETGQATDTTPLRFSGSVTLRDKKSSAVAIAGSQVLAIADYHWADANRDNRVEDAEILAVYDTFSALDTINYDWQKIDEIWSGDGYHWDAAKEEYVIQK